jgi:hypothetical protein
MSLDVAPGIRTAILADSTITALLSTYQGAASVHTRIPVPTGVSLPHIVIGPDVAVSDYDGLRSDRPIVLRDVFVYGAAGSSRQDDYRDVETIAYALRALFHRQKSVLSVDDYDVVSVTVSGPVPAPSNDEEIIGRVVTLTIRLRSSA